MIKKLNEFKTIIGLIFVIMSFQLLIAIGINPVKNLKLLALSLPLFCVGMAMIILDKIASEKPTQEPVQPTEPTDINGMINQKLNSGIIEDAIDKQFDKMVDNALNDLFGNYGDVTKAVRNKLSDQMITSIEKYNVADHAEKFEILMKNAVQAVENKQEHVVENIRAALNFKTTEELTVDELFDAITDIISKNVDTSDLNVNYDDGKPYYDDLIISLTTNDITSDGSFNTLTAALTCEQDDSFNYELEFKQFKNYPWRLNKATHLNNSALAAYQRKLLDQTHSKDAVEIIHMDTPMRILNHMSALDMLFIHLANSNTKFTDLDSYMEVVDEDVEVEEQPEPTYC